MKTMYFLPALLLAGCTNGPKGESDAAPTKKVINDSLERVAQQVRLDSLHLAELNEALAYVDGYDLKEHEGYEALHYIETCKILNEHGILAVRWEDSEDARKGVLAKSLKKKLVAMRVRVMPVLRKRWADAAGRKLWEQDIEVRAYGKGNTTLELVGGTFAANANIKTVQESIQDGVELLRFKRVNYKWYSGADEYQYYTIKSPPDSEL